MHKTYKLSHQLVAYILLLSLFLQSCGNHSIPSVPLPQGASPSLPSNIRQKQYSNASLLRVSSEQDGYSASTDNLSRVQTNNEPIVNVEEMAVSFKGDLHNSADISSNSNALPILINQSAAINEKAEMQGSVTHQVTHAKPSKSSAQAFQARRHGKITGKWDGRQELSASHSIAALLTNQVYIAQGGYQVRFEKQAEDALQAIVEHQYFKGIPKRILPVIINLDSSYSAAAIKNPIWQKQYIQVLKDYVYVGSKGGKGGMGEEGGDKNPENKAKENEKDKEKETEKEEMGQSVNNNILEQLLKITTAKGIKTTVSNIWATGEGIDNALNNLLQDQAHILAPDFSGTHSPASEDEDNAIQGTIDYAKAISERILLDGGILARPIIMILNTTPVGVLRTHDMTKEGGLHWQTCVILPKNYTSLSGKSLDNKEEIIFYVDSLNPDKEIPSPLLYILKGGGLDILKTENTTRIRAIKPIFPNIEVKHKLGAKQQKDGWSCGWWAVYNALMILYTGDIKYVEQFKNPSNEIAYKLRTLLPGLDEKPVEDKKSKEKPTKTHTSHQSSLNTRTEEIDSRLVPGSLTPGGLKPTQHGVSYQLALLTLAAIRAHNNGKNFYLVSEANECEKFDDLVIDYGDSITFLQAKHSSKDPKEDGYTKTDFCADPESKDKKKSGASLAKYFDSWLRLKRGEYVKKENGEEKTSKFIFFTNRHIKDGDMYLEPAKLEADEFLFKGLETKTLRFNEGDSRNEFIDAIRAYSKEVAKDQGNDIIPNLKTLDKELQAAAEYLQKIYIEKAKPGAFHIGGHSHLPLKIIALVGLLKAHDNIKNAILIKNSKAFQEWLDNVTITTKIRNCSNIIDVSSVSEDEWQAAVDYLQKIYTQKARPGSFHIDGHSKLPGRIICLIDLLKTKQYIKNRILSIKVKRFQDWLENVTITTNITSPNKVLDARMEKEIQQFLDEFIIKVEQPSVTPLFELLVDDFKLNSNIGGQELFNAINNRMYQWLSDPKACLLKSNKFGSWMKVEEGDLNRFYLLGNTKIYEQEFEGNYPLDLNGLEIKKLYKFLSEENKLTLAVINENENGGIKARVYQTIKKLAIQDTEWAFLTIDSRNIPRLPDILAGNVTKFIIVDCRGSNRLPKENEGILHVAAENGKKIVLLVNHMQRKELSSLLNEKKDICRKFNLNALTDKQVLGICKQYTDKYLSVGGKYLQLSSVLKSKGSGLYKQLTNIDALYSIIKSLVDAKGNFNSGLPYNVYVENDLVRLTPAYSLLSLLQTVNVGLFIIEGVNKQQLDTWLQQNLKHTYVVGNAAVSEDTRYRLVDNIDSKLEHIYKEKLIYISDGKEINHSSYLQLKLINQEEYEVTVTSKSNLVKLPVPSRYYDFSQNESHDKEVKIKHAGFEFLKEQRPMFSILTAHAGFGKSAFCLKQCDTWRGSEEGELSSWVVRINLPQLELRQQPSFLDAFTKRATSEDWPDWKLKALQYDMQTAGRVFLLLDGFDEIKDERTVQLLNNWISNLSDTVSVLITTRPYAANKIMPNNAMLRCMTLREYNEVQHKQYIYRYLDVLFKEISNEKEGFIQPSEQILSLSANVVYEQLKSLISKSTSRLLGIPLESYIFCEALRPYIRDHYLKLYKKKKAKDALDESISSIFSNVLTPSLQTSLEDISFNYEIDGSKEDFDELDIKSIFSGLRQLNVATLYQHFILSKLQMFLQKHMQMEADTTLRLKHRAYTLTASYTELLMAFAFRQAFSLSYDHLSVMLRMIHYNAGMICELYDTGLVELINYGNEYTIKFNHETYQEYFAALHILKGLAGGKGDMYNAVKQAIIEHCYMPKYRMIMIMAAQLSVSGDPIIPAWNQNDKEQLRKFWKTLATAGDVLGAASSKLLKDCLQGLLPEQISKLSEVLKGYDWGVHILQCIGEVEKKRNSKVEIEGEFIQDIDIPFDTESTSFQSKQISRMSNKEKDKLRCLFKDKSKVVSATKDALATISQDELAQIFAEIVGSEANTLNSYWDIDGGFQAMVLLGNCFNMQHANYFVKRIEKDPSWRTMPALNAVRSLLAQNPKGEAKIACDKVLLCLAEQYEHISDAGVLRSMLRIFFKPIMEALIARFNTEISIQTVSEKIKRGEGIQMSDCSLSNAVFYESVCNFIKMLDLAYHTGYAVIPIKDYSVIRFVGDTEIKCELGNTSLMKVFQRIVSGIFTIYKEICDEYDREGLVASEWISENLHTKQWRTKSLKLLNEDYEEKVFAIVIQNKDIFKAWFEQVKDDSRKLYNLYKQIAKSGLIDKHHAEIFTSELGQKGSQAMKMRSYWSKYGGIETTQFCWRYFNKKIADYLILRAGWWEDNMSLVKYTLNVIRGCLLANSADDATYEEAIAAYNFAAEEINKDPNGWLEGQKLEVIIPQKTQLRFLKAVKHNSEQEVRKLLNVPGLDVNFKNNAHFSALHLVALSGNYIIATFLLSQPIIDVNIQDAKGRTPLHIIASRGNWSVAQRLVAHPNIQLNLLDAKGRTALDMAKKYNHKSLIIFLLVKSVVRDNNLK
ncbi:hypothetical protein Aasi_0501 [Candidatus Amoebophilus asiaticus 5a2]|uniref:NACHT domain-containing protein n=1 Tax=Amoebophilus asiaticus (strain 5a2) TaxID=452471 RepID=B3ERQ4_AMOA5|nr:ankyrin repeat domain-containing protein [Candidatus Amoebophilus asiaticus]ACE05906.1 hypothetical protein Aasi_0501 [Candidatus Amoebophilus asiaticus 5a2]